MSSAKLTTQVYNQSGEKVKDIKLNPEIFDAPVKESVVHQVAVAQMANSRVAIAHTKTKGEVRGGGIKPWRQKGTGRARHGSIRSPLWVGGGITFGPRKDRNFAQKVNKKQKTKALFMCLSDKVNQGWLVLLDKLELQNGKTREMVEVVRKFKDVLKLKESRPVPGQAQEIKNQESRRKIESNKNRRNEALPRSSQESSEKIEQNGSSQRHGANNKFDIKKYKLSLLIILPKSDREVFNAGRNLEGVKIITADSLNVVDLLRYKKVILVEDGLKIIESTYLKK